MCRSGFNLQGERHAGRSLQSFYKLRYQGQYLRWLPLMIDIDFTLKCRRRGETFPITQKRGDRKGNLLLNCYSISSKMQQVMEIAAAPIMIQANTRFVFQ